MMRRLFVYLMIVGCITFFQRPASAEWGDLVLDATLESMQKEGVNPVIYSHSLHRIRYKCKTCHFRIFKMEKGGNNINMKGIKEGKFCGKCHNGKIAFSADSDEACDRCHKYEGGSIKKVVVVSDKAADKKLFMELPRDKWGIIKWIKIVKEGLISPIAGVGDERYEDILDDREIKLKVQSKWVADVMFPHVVHTYWLTQLRQNSSGTALFSDF